MKTLEPLPRRYRPQTWDELVEQGPIRKILEYQLSTNTVRSVNLFTGPAGTGKTTSARIFANKIEPVKTNIVEIDGASYTGVDNVRSIIDNCKTKPLNGTHKIFIIDEVHMLSQAAFNSLLKILEEPPSYCIFILCTTDPQKIIPTILSRATRYDFQKISYDAIVNRLNYVLEQELHNEEGCGIQTWDKQALEFIANASQGGMRDALTLLDKCVSYTPNITVDAVLTVLDMTSYDVLFNLLDGIINKDQPTIIKLIDEIYKKGKDLKLFVKTFLGFVLDVQKFILLHNTTYINIPVGYTNKLQTYNDQNLKMLIFNLLTLNTQLKWETNVKTVLESTLLLETM